MVKLLFVVLAMAISCKLSWANVCTEIICKIVKCTPPDCKPGQVEEPGFCGCCRICVNLLKKGANCSLSQIQGTPPTVRCKDGLICKDNICQ